MYLLSAKSVAPSFALLQTDLQHFNSSLLQQKLPIILEDKIVDIEEVVANMFKYLYVSRYNDTSLSFPFQIVVCNSKYTLLYNNSPNQPFHIRIYHPRHVNNRSTNPSLLSINTHSTVLQQFDAMYQIVRLHPSKMIIIPHKWGYSIDDDVTSVHPENLARVHLHDLITYWT